MCGFAGEFVFTDTPADVDLAGAMAGRLEHRGPDDGGSFISADRRCAIGFRRLAVIDPAGSRQPMSLPDRSVTVAFNGEIYNFPQLRRELASEGVTLRTHGDTEVLPHLYRRDGTAMLQQLDGMFAFAIYDEPRSRLLLARDRLGQKPLWYAMLTDRIVFASEAKALLGHPLVSGDPDWQSLTTYLSMGYIPSPKSAWRGVAKLAPAEALIVTGPADRPAVYWKPTFRPSGCTEQQLIQQARQRLCASVRARMVSDVPLGALLSGGVDSAIIVALMAQSAGASGGVRTFTAGFEDQQFDERPAARRTAQHCRTDHTEITVRCEPAECLDNIVDMYDEPFGDSSALPTYLICRAARRHVTVALAGDGGDEVFGGYDRYRAIHLAATMGPAAASAARLAAVLIKPFARQDQRSSLRRLVRFADGLLDPLSWQYFRYRRLFGPSDLARLLTPQFLGGVDVNEAAEWFCNLYEAEEFDDEVARAQRHDMLTYLGDDILVKTDIASMGASLELRAPMLDHRLAELGLSLPVRLKLNRRRGKIILRRAFGDVLRPEVFTRPKRGFGVPLSRWLRVDLRETMIDTLLDEGFLGRGVFQRTAVAGLVNDHLRGKGDHSGRLWAMLVMARWLAKYG